MNDMSRVYMSYTLKHLRELRSQKILRIIKLKSNQFCYLNKQELKKLNYQVDRIEAVIRAKEDQMYYPVEEA